MELDRKIRAAEVVLTCAELAKTLAFFTERLGFRLDAISPADAPAVATLSGHGMRIRLDATGRAGSAGTLRLLCDDPAALGGGATELIAPNGTRIELAVAEQALVVPPLEPALVVSRGASTTWQTGRAGMRYRDLIPGRQGGRFIASHIAIPEGGPVADSVHFHRIRFQLIYCARGWVSVVYEDQGPPFTLSEGDCVLQPPGIRHRVLESSPGLEVIEVTCPAEHETVIEHELALPTTTARPERRFGGQRFVHHRAAGAAWLGRSDGFEARDVGLGEASGGLVGAAVLRPNRGASSEDRRAHELELLLLVVLRGAVELRTGAHVDHRMETGDAAVVPAGMDYALAGVSSDLEILEVSSPAAS